MRRTAAPRYARSQGGLRARSTARRGRRWSRHGTRLFGRESWGVRSRPSLPRHDRLFLVTTVSSSFPLWSGGSEGEETARIPAGRLEDSERATRQFDGVRAQGLQGLSAATCAGLTPRRRAAPWSGRSPWRVARSPVRVGSCADARIFKRELAGSAAQRAERVLCFDDQATHELTRHDRSREGAGLTAEQEYQLAVIALGRGVM